MKKTAGTLVAVGVLTSVVSGQALAQVTTNAIQFTANSIGRMIVLGVEQGISSLPPTSGQSFSYEFDPSLDTYVASERLGPTSFRSPQTVGVGHSSLRLAASYFELADSFEPIPYIVNDSSGHPLGALALGAKADAQVGLLNLSFNHGFTDRFEMSINLPVVVVDAHGAEIFTSRAGTSSLPAREAPVSGPAIVINPTTGKPDIPQTLVNLNTALHENLLFLRKESFGALGFRFNSENHLGIGRIGLGAKGLLYTDRVVQLAVAPEVFLPSPSEGSFAGSDTGAILPRVVAAFSLSDALKLHVDAGYAYDFEVDELRRIVWNFGPSLALNGATFDVGVSGSKFNSGIAWTPASASFRAFDGSTLTLQQAAGSNRLGSNFIDALVGVKVRLGEKSVLSGSVNVPLNNEGFRAPAVGTVAGELYF
jgi:outer membrane putative beta-barrel porin/alpha-amylase